MINHRIIIENRSHMVDPYVVLIPICRDPLYEALDDINIGQGNFG